jgi:hypothetical protein
MYEYCSVKIIRNLAVKKRQIFASSRSRVATHCVAEPVGCEIESRSGLNWGLEPSIINAAKRWVPSSNAAGRAHSHRRLASLMIIAQCKWHPYLWPLFLFTEKVFKGSVQQKLRWVKTGVNQWVWASVRGRAVDIVLLWKLASILFIAYFRFWSVLPNLQGSSGIMGEALWATQRRYSWRYIENTANIIGAVLHPALIGEAVRIRRAFRWGGSRSPCL